MEKIAKLACFFTMVGVLVLYVVYPNLRYHRFDQGLIMSLWFSTLIWALYEDLKKDRKAFMKKLEEMKKVEKK